jgi:hypothetical protein
VRFFSYPGLNRREELNNCIVLVDFPVKATFLTPEERSYVIWKKSTEPRYPDTVHVEELTLALEYDNSTVGEAEHFEMKYVVAAITDWQVWLQILVYMSIVGPSMSSLLIFHVSSG